MASTYTIPTFVASVVIVMLILSNLVDISVIYDIIVYLLYIVVLLLRIVFSLLVGNFDIVSNDIAEIVNVLLLIVQSIYQNGLVDVIKAIFNVILFFVPEATRQQILDSVFKNVSITIDNSQTHENIIALLGVDPWGFLNSNYVSLAIIGFGTGKNKLFNKDS